MGNLRNLLAKEVRVQNNRSKSSSVFVKHLRGIIDLDWSPYIKISNRFNYPQVPPTLNVNKIETICQCGVYKCMYNI